MPTLDADHITGTRYELGTTVLRVETGSTLTASAADREAILTSLYEERRKLTKAKRLGQASASDDEYLVELNRYIDRWEAPETQAATSDDVWRKLDALAGSLLGVQAKSCFENYQRNGQWATTVSTRHCDSGRSNYRP